MKRKCAITGKEFEITEQDQNIYKKLEVPFPTLCPEERHRRKMAFRNERSLYKRKCGLCGEEMISMYDPSGPYVVYCNKCWWSDKWDPMKYGRDFDFNRPFYEQFDKLNKEVPKYALDSFDHENSAYCNYSCHVKDCYMMFGHWHNEKCMYGNTILFSLEVNDSAYCNECKYSYELTDCNNCYELFYARDCSNCSNSYFLFDCKSCQSCLFCWNLRNKKYHILNKEVKKEGFEKKVRELEGSYEKFQEALQKWRKVVENEAIHKFMEGEKNENSTGNLLYGCKNANDVFYGIEAEDVTHSIRTTKHQKDSVDIMGNSAGELMYDSIHCDICHRGKFSASGEHNSDFTYCSNCYQCDNIFGCVNLRHKKYCILNKQYSKEEYEKLIPRIVDHMTKTIHPETKGPEWGEFLPTSVSPFCYNETVAQEYFPLMEKEAEARGFRWKKENPRERLPQKIKLPDKIGDTDENIIKEILACEQCGKNYKIAPAEFKFYKKYSLPIPRKCFGCRHMDRLKRRLPYKTFDRACTKCGKALKSSYSKDRHERVYCEECYLKEVY